MLQGNINHFVTIQYLSNQWERFQHIVDPGDTFFSQFLKNESFE